MKYYSAIYSPFAAVPKIFCFGSIRNYTKYVYITFLNIFFLLTLTSFLKIHIVLKLSLYDKVKIFD